VTRHFVLRGEFVHASLYFGHLTVVTYEGGVRRVQLPWLTSDAPRGELQGAADPTALPAGAVEQLDAPSEAEILTLHSYDGVTYFGGDDGLWALTEPGYPGATGTRDYAHVSTRPTLHLDTTFGVGAVAHGDGLSVLPLGSSWLGDDFFTPMQDEADSPADAVVWSHHDLLTRSAPLVHELIPANFELRSRDDENHYVFQGLTENERRAVLDGGMPISAVAPRSYASWDAAADSATVFRKRRDGWRLDHPERGADAGQHPNNPLIATLEGRVISLREFGSYVACELSDRVVALDNKGRRTVVLDHPATDIRTYPRSNRYRGIISAVSELGVHLFVFG
jgi:hypothetical protein